MPLTPKRIALLQRVKQRILAEPQRFNMDYVFNSYADEQPPSDVDETHLLRHFTDNECHTTACIAGHVLVESGRKNLNDVAVYIAAKLIGSGDMFPPLFYDYEWPADLADQYSKAKTRPRRARLAAEAIDRWIASNGSFAE